jgi:hypothetical protein
MLIRTKRPGGTHFCCLRRLLECGEILRGGRYLGRCYHTYYDAEANSRYRAEGSRGVRLQSLETWSVGKLRTGKLASDTPSRCQWLGSALNLT